MEKNRHKKKYSNNNWKNQNNNQQNRNQNRNDSRNEKSKVFQPKLNYETEEALKEKQKAIQEIKAREVVCAKCGMPITDISSALNDKSSGKPVHFECALNQVSENEKLGENEKIAYIGQGRFGVLYYENMRDQRHFTIKRIIEWEDRDSKPEWRTEISEVYSKIN